MIVPVLEESVVGRGVGVTVGVAVGVAVGVTVGVAVGVTVDMTAGTSVETAAGAEGCSSVVVWTGSGVLTAVGAGAAGCETGSACLQLQPCNSSAKTRTHINKNPILFIV